MSHVIKMRRLAAGFHSLCDPFYVRRQLTGPQSAEMMADAVLAFWVAHHRDVCSETAGSS